MRIRVGEMLVEPGAGDAAHGLAREGNALQRQVLAGSRHQAGSVRGVGVLHQF